MTNSVLMEYWEEMKDLQSQLHERSCHDLSARPLIRKIQGLRLKINKLENPLPKKNAKVKAGKRRV